jgi:hypothetical protein
MGVWRGVAMDSLMFHPGLPCLTVLCPVGRPLLKRPHGHIRGDPRTGWAACDCLLPIWTLHPVHLWWGGKFRVGDPLLKPDVGMIGS